MPINRYELESFTNRWLQKARGYQEESLSDLFDKFFTLFVVYNRIYVEAGKVLISDGHPVVRRFSINKRYAKQSRLVTLPVAPLPDRFGATEVVPTFLRVNELKEHLEIYCSRDVEYITSTVQDGRFYFYYDYANDVPNTQKDIEVAKKANKFLPHAVLDLLYTARCNMFHGSKEFHSVQAPLLKAMNNILENTINLALDGLLERHS